MIKSVWAAVAAAAGLGVAGGAQAACELARISEIPVEMRGLDPTIAAQLNGKTTTFTIDTGAAFSVVTSEAKAQFALRPTVVPFGAQVRGFGGTSRDAQAGRADLFSFGGMGFPNIDFLVGGRFGGGDISGVLGQNIMGAFDVEYDFANGMMRFYKAQDCKDANLAYWSAGKALSRVDIEEARRYVIQIIVPVYVNGHRLKAQLDTGAPVSYLSLHAAQRQGIQATNDGVEAAGLSYGAFGKGVETYLAPFASFKIGDEEIKNTRLRIANIDLGNDADMLLGADFFLSHRVLVSNTQKKLYFTYNGGPVFRLENRPAPTQTAQGAPPAATGSAAPPAEAGKTDGGGAVVSASEHARRGSALAARREFAEAVAEYSRAIELDPKDGATYRARAMARLGARQPLLAMADLDEALKLKPDDLQALILRAEMFLQGKDLARAKGDFEAAQKAAPANADLSAQIGLAYARAGLYDEGVRHLDAWIAAHPRSEDIGRALAARCWTRGLSGAGLDLALADCDQALKRDRNSEVMSYRGLVLYRMGRLDEAISQYGQALKAQPRLAQALYGRGLVELKKGDTTQGQADIAQASEIAPGLAQEYRRAGLAPPAAPGGKAGG
jgi:tetratricopeptide (TPR) repeat protein